MNTDMPREAGSRSAGTQKYKIKKIVIVIIGLIFLAAGCGGGGNTVNNGPIILTVWKTFEDSQNLQPLFDMYTQKHPNVQIVYSKKNYETYEQDLLNALASGQGPDIFSIHNDWLPKFLDKTTPAPEKTFSLRDYKTDFVDVVVEDFTHEDKIYGTALAVDSLGLYYNKDILGSVGIATPPKTWGELSSQVQRIKKADGRGYFTTSGVAMGNTSNINRAVDILYLLMLQKRVQAYTPDKQRPSFADSFQDKNNNYTNPGLTALTFYTSFANPSSINYNWNARSDYSVDAFTNGRAAFMFSYAYMAQTIKLKNANLNFDVAPVPQPSLEETSMNFSNY
jgi:ABC-type glycerol-3-phosphate transport system substrate-binding protein